MSRLEILLLFVMTINLSILFILAIVAKHLLVDGISEPPKLPKPIIPNYIWTSTTHSAALPEEVFDDMALETWAINNGFYKREKTLTKNKETNNVA